MSKTSLPSSLIAARTEESKGFNYNKLQAVLCIAASAAVSVAGLYWLAGIFF